MKRYITTIETSEALKMGEKNKDAKRIVAQNKKAYHDYFVEEKYEAGIALFGTEVKSIRAGTVNLKDSYCSFEKGEMFVIHEQPFMINELKKQIYIYLILAFICFILFHI